MANNFRGYVLLPHPVYFDAVMTKTR